MEYKDYRDYMYDDLEKREENLKKFLGDDLNRMGIFESYSIIEKIKYSYTGKVKKIILTVETTVKS